MEMLALLMRCLLDILTLCHSQQKRGVVLDMRVVYLRGRVSVGPFLLGGVLIHFEGCSEDSMYLFFSLLLDTLLLYMRSCDHL